MYKQEPGGLPNLKPNSTFTALRLVIVRFKFPHGDNDLAPSSIGEMRQEPGRATRLETKFEVNGL